MNNRKMNSIGLIALFLVVAIPLAYSATEPSVIVNMSSTQTEKPIQVKDHLGTEVFSVDVDGTVFPSVSTPATEILFYEDNSQTPITHVNDGTGDFNTWTEIAKWRVDFNSPSVDDENDPPNSEYPNMFNKYEMVTGFISSSSASANADLAVRYSFDESTWIHLGGISRDAGGFTPTTEFSGQVNYADNNGEDICFRTDISEDECFISLRLGADGLTTHTSLVKDFSMYIELFVPPQTTITQVLP